MDYPFSWDRLSEAVAYVMATCGIPKNDAQSFICEAISRRGVEIQCKLRRHQRGGTWRFAIPGTDVEIPTPLKRQHLDWDESRPLTRWLVRRGGSATPGFWELEWIEISRASLTAIVRVAQEQSEATQNASSQSPPMGPPAAAPASPPISSAASSPRRRGPRPKRFEQVRDAMRASIQQGRYSAAELGALPEKTLAEDHKVSRDTARRARKAVMSEFDELNSRQTPTNDK